MQGVFDASKTWKYPNKSRNAASNLNNYSVTNSPDKCYLMQSQAVSPTIATDQCSKFSFASPPNGDKN